MARRDKYHINYEKLYPGIEIPPEVLSVLRKGDRKEEYQEVDLKQERFVYDPETKTAYFIPGREDSYERLIEDEKRQFSNEDPTPEEHLIRNIENELLRQAVALLKEDERISPNHQEEPIFQRKMERCGRWAFHPLMTNWCRSVSGYCWKQFMRALLRKPRTDFALIIAAIRH